MNFRTINILLLMTALCLGLCEQTPAGGHIPSLHESALLELINEAREDPLAMAGSLGMDPGQILKDLPWLQGILEEGLPPLTFNQHLYMAAGSHTRDMLLNDYYSYTSPDGGTCEDRIRESGYAPAATGESLGLLAFDNFIEADEAVEVIFENMFRDELDPFREEQRNILNPDLEEAGVAFRSGTLTVDSSNYNVYLVTCDFAASAVSVTELELFELVNQARANPLGMAASLGMDPERVLADLPDLHDILTQGLPPLTFSGKLYASATAHTVNMLEKGYFSHISPDGRNAEDRIRASGYVPLFTGESMGLFSFCNDAAAGTGAWFIFKTIFTWELKPDSGGQRNILDPALREVGVGFTSGTSGSLGGICDNIQLLVLDFATGLDPSDPGIVGLVYYDVNQDGLYGQGEGVSGVSISLAGSCGFVSLPTNEAGGFAVSLDPGAYWVVARIGEYEMVEYVELEAENKAVRFAPGP